MKTKFYFLSVLAGVVLLASCGGGISDATKKNVAAFDSSWNAMANGAKAWSDSLTAAMTACENGCKMDTGMKCCEHMKGKMDSMCKATCGKDMDAYNGLKSEMDAAHMAWDSTAAKWAEFKGKVDKGEIKDDEATKTLADFQTQMDAASSGMTAWVTKLMDAKKACMANCMACMTACKDMKCTDKKCDMGKKTK